MDGQQEMKIKDSNMIQFDFVRCGECEDHWICPHAFKRDGCRTIEKVKEVIGWEG